MLGLVNIECLIGSKHHLIPVNVFKKEFIEIVDVTVTVFILVTVIVVSVIVTDGIPKNVTG